MTTKKISAMDAASALGGTEAFEAVQSAATKKVTAAQLKTFVSASPTLVTPALGTPSSGNLANCTLGGSLTSAAIAAALGGDPVLADGSVPFTAAAISQRVFVAYRYNAAGLSDENGLLATINPNGSSDGVTLPLTAQTGDLGPGLFDPQGWLQLHPSQDAEDYQGASILAQTMEHRTLRLTPGIYYGYVGLGWDRAPSDAGFYFNAYWLPAHTSDDGAGAQGRTGFLSLGPGFDGTGPTRGRPTTSDAGGYFVVDGDQLEIFPLLYAAGGTGADLKIIAIQATVIRIA